MVLLSGCIVIKASLAFMALLLLVPLALAVSRTERRRELLFLAMPVAIHLGVAMASGMNIGVRHILPIFPFLVALVLLFDVVSSVRAFPTYLAYANELWGGPSQTYKYLTDSNVDWAQQLKTTKQYLDGRGIKECWFAYFGQGVLEPHYYGIPSKPLLTADSLWINERIDVPPM